MKREKISENIKNNPKTQRMSKKLYAAISLFIVSSILMTAVTFAWVTLSLSPEVRGMNTTVTGNGSLEIALMPGSGLFSDITSGRGASGAFAGGTRELTEANNSWGNIINLNDAVYGLDLVTLRPARLSYNSETNVINDSPLSTPEWSYDGRITSLRGTYTASHYTNDNFSVSSGFKGNRYGVRAVLDVDKDTYGYITDLAFRLNTESEGGVPGKLLLQQYGAQRIYSGSGDEATQGKGSCFTFVDEFGNEIDDYSKTYAKKYLECLRIAFISDYGNAAVDSGRVIAFARANTESGELYICNKSGSVLTGDDADVILPAMEKNKAYQISVLVWLDGDAVTNANLTITQRILKKATLNLQFATDIELVPANVSEIENGEIAIVDSGECGEGVEWNLDETGLLTIEGDGNISDSELTDTPFKDHLLSIKKVKIESGVTGIGDYTFANCSNLNSITFSSGLTHIGQNAFAGCGKLSLVNYDGTIEQWNAIETGEGNTELENSVIYCTNGALNEPDLTIHGECGENAEWTLDADGVLTVSGTGNTSDYETGESPWYEYKDNIVKAVIENGITSIGENLFEDCVLLTEISIPESVTVIKENAFSGCVELYEVNYAGESTAWNTLISEAEDGNEVLSDVVVRCSDTTLNEPRIKASGDCTDNISWTIDENGLLTVSGTGAMPDYENGGAPWYAKRSMFTKAVIDDGITSVGSGAFYGCEDLTRAVLPVGLDSIGAYAFCGCSALENVNIPTTVTSIGEHAFDGCTVLTDIALHYGLESIGDHAFSGCAALNDVNIPTTVTTTGEHVFENCTSLTSSVLQNGMLTVPAYAFSGCSMLDSVIMPASVTAIDEGAFADCTSLTYAELPASLQTIGSGAFSGSGLKAVTIPSGVTNIADNAFENCPALTTVNYTGTSEQWNSVVIGDNNDGLTSASVYSVADITDANRCGDNAGWVLDGDGVLTIFGYGAMKNYSENYDYTSHTYKYNTPWYSRRNSIKSVIINSGITSIGNYTFYNCSNITNVTIPDSVTSIGGATFYNCNTLTSVTIPDGVTSIGSSAFYGCRSLTSVTIPGSVTSISSDAFRYCDRLTAVYITDLSKWCDISFGNEYANPLYYAHNLYLNGEKITDLVIPDGVTSIGSYAFEGCSSLTNVTIPDGVTSIGYDAFRYCDRLTAVYITDLSKWCDISFGNEYANPLYYAHDLYLNGEKITDLVIPEDVTSIGSYAFISCNTITSVTIPDSVTSIGGCAFWYCDGLTAVYITDLSKWCDISFENEYANPLYYAHDLYLNDVRLTDIVVPDGNTKVNAHAFVNSSIKDVFIPASVDSIDISAFYGCDLDSISVNEMNPVYYSTADCIVHKESKTLIYGCKNSLIPTDGNLTTIGYNAFYKCRSLTKISIPDNIKIIDNCAFYECIGLTSVTIGNSVTSIGDYVFYNCSSLTSVMIPDSVISIGDSAFYGCYSLTSISIPDSVTSIGVYAFLSCYSLIYNEYDNALYLGNTNNPYHVLIKANDESITSITSVDIHKKTKIIHHYAFSGCSSLTSVTVPDSVTSIGYGAFQECWNLASITIPFIGESNSSNQYIGYIFGGSIPSSLKEIIISNKCTTIPNNAFYACSSLVSVTIPDSVTSIGDYAFSGCSSLTSLTVPDSVTSIGYGAFQECWNLASITIPFIGESNSSNQYIGYIFGTLLYSNNYDYVLASLKDITISDKCTTIPNNAFYACSSLVSVTIPDSVTSIGNYAFSGCSSLTSVTIPDSVTSIGSSAFSGCSSLVSVTIPDSVTSIGNYAFSGCSNLSNVTIPDSVTSIGVSAFYNCSSLTSVTIPDSVTSIGERAFSGCSGLESVTVSDNNEVYHSSGNCVIETESKTLILGCKNSVIPDSVTSIGNYAFSGCSNITNVIIPYSVTSIGGYAFYGCSNITNVIIPYSVTSIGSCAFASCTRLTSVAVHNIGTITDQFSGCTGLKTVIIGSGINTIGSEAFKGCNNLETVFISDSVNSIGYCAFYGCTRLTDVYYNGTALQWNNININKNRNVSVYDAQTNRYKTVTYQDGNDNIINAQKHYGNYSGQCGNSATWYLDKNNVLYISGSGATFDYASGSTPWNDSKGDITTVIIENGITGIGANMFSDFSALTSVTIPDGVTSIGDYVFYNCSSLTSIEYSGTITQWNSISKGNSWNYNTGNYTIYCTDENIPK